MQSLVRLFCLIALVYAAPAVVDAQKIPVAATTPSKATTNTAASTTSASKQAPTNICHLLGPGWKKLGHTTFCKRSNGGAFNYMSQDFAKSDIFLHGARTPNSVPLIFSGRKDVSSDTKYPKFGTVLAYNLDLIGQLPMGPVMLHFGIVANPELSFGPSGNSHLNANFWNNSTSRPILYGGDGGLIHEAWVRYSKFQIGIQQSKFDFLHGGYSVGQSYTPQDTTASIVYTLRTNNKFSLAFALEDPKPRELQDGILNHYKGNSTPDLVVQARFKPKNNVYHLAGAIHLIKDQLSPASARHTAVGYAAIFAFEHKFLWSRALNHTPPKYLGAAGSLYASIALAHGALGYLGSPYFATDYVVGNTGGLHLSNGITAMVSYENVWSSTLKGNITLSYFRSDFGAESTIPYSYPGGTSGGIDFGERFVTSGERLSIGVEKLLKNNARLGTDIAMNWTRSRGTANGLGLPPISSRFPDAMVYYAIPF